MNIHMYRAGHAFADLKKIKEIQVADSIASH